MKLPVPPSFSGDSRLLMGELQSLSNWNRQLWDALQGLPTISKFSGTHPNLSRITGTQGDLAINVGSASTGTVMWILAGASGSTTSSWKAVVSVAVA